MLSGRFFYIVLGGRKHGVDLERLGDSLRLVQAAVAYVQLSRKGAAGRCTLDLFRRERCERKD